MSDQPSTTAITPGGPNTGGVWRGHGPRNPFFTGRDAALAELDQRLRQAERSHVQAIVGFGGIGKTQLAGEFAWRYRQHYRIVWWLPAEDATTLGLAFADLARQLRVPIPPAASLDMIRHDLRRFLGERDNWLLVFDNASSPEAIKDYLPIPCNGRVLITSRDTEWDGVAETYALRQMDRVESIAFLKRRVPRADPEPVLQRVAAALGDHPLAMEQAAAHVLESRINFSAYLKRFEAHWAELLADGGVRSTPGAEYPDSLAMSLELTFRQLGEANPESQALLNLCSYFSGENIQQSLLDSATSAAGELPAMLIGVLTDPSVRSEAMLTLRRYSLIEANADNELQIHRLVSLLVRRRLSLVERNELARIALAAVKASFVFDSDDPQTWAASNAVLPHLLSAASHAEQEEVDLAEAAPLLNLAGRLMLKQNQLPAARDAMVQSLNIAKRIHGPNNPWIAIMSNDLGRVLQKMGDPIGAREQFEHSLHIDEKVYGDNDVHLTSVVNNYAITLHGDRDFDAARERLDKALSIATFHYGSDDRRVATIRNNLACVLRDEGEIAAARNEFETALKGARNACGESAPLVAQIAYNFGGMLRRIGELPAALSLLELAHRIDSSHFPPDHPDVVRDVRELQRVRSQLSDAVTADS